MKLDFEGNFDFLNVAVQCAVFDCDKLLTLCKYLFLNTFEADVFSLDTCYWKLKDYVWITIHTFPTVIIMSPLTVL